MDKEYIDRGVIVHMLMNIPNAAKQTFDVVCNAPAADVAPVVHSYWEPYYTPISPRQQGWICKNCSGVAESNANGDTNYCPNCGARMDLEGRDG